jgi:multicomponent Na+:H+ antiporter subunit D
MSGEIAIALSVAIPLTAALLIWAAGRQPNLRDGVTLVAAIALCLVVYGGLLPEVLAGGRPSLTLLEPLPGLALAFEVEPLGMTFACVASFLWIVNSLFSVGYMRGNKEPRQTRFYICFAIALASTMGLAMAGNLLTLFLCYEALTLSTYPLVAHHKNDEAVQSGRTYLGILMFTSIVFLMTAIIATWAISGEAGFAVGGILSGKAGPAVGGALLLLYIYGIGKAAVMPFHKWLPAAMVAPTPVSALLHAVAVVKAGVFSVVKISVYVFGIDYLKALAASDLVLYLAGFTIISASIIAMRQDNLKRRLAYSTVSQLSYVVLAAFILSPLSTIGAALHIVAHAFGKITLFMAAGAIYTAAHKTEVSQLDGIGRRMPWTMGAFLIGTLSMVGIPPAAGFLSKWYMLLGALQVEHYVAIAVIVISTLLNASYFFPIVYAAFLRPEKAAPEHPHGEAPWPIVVALTTTATLTVLIFFFADIPLQLASDLAGVSNR